MADFYKESITVSTDADVLISSIRKLNYKFNNVVSKIGSVDIETMKEIVEISALIEDLKYKISREGGYERVSKS